MENKVIYAIMDTDTIRDYIANDHEMFEEISLNHGGDGNDIPDNVRNLIVSEIIENSTDGRLARMIREVFNDSLAQSVIDSVYECMDTFVYDEANRILESYAMKANS